MDAARLTAIGAAALVAGAVNAIAGGGSLLTFPVLVAAGLSPVTASLTNTVAMLPGYAGATFAQRRELSGQAGRLRRLVPVALAAGVAGALLLLHTTAASFDRVVPFLLLLAVALVAFQTPIRHWLSGRDRAAPVSEAWSVLPVAIAGTYGGYFAAGMGVIVLAALGIIVDDSLRRMNALKQAITVAINIAATAVFVASGRVDWPVALVMMACSLGGGLAGGALASRVSARALRIVIVVLGLGVSLAYFARW